MSTYEIVTKTLADTIQMLDQDEIRQGIRIHAELKSGLSDLAEALADRFEDADPTFDRDAFMAAIPTPIIYQVNRSTRD